MSKIASNLRDFFNKPFPQLTLEQKRKLFTLNDVKNGVLCHESQIVEDAEFEVIEPTTTKRQFLKYLGYGNNSEIPQHYENEVIQVDPLQIDWGWANGEPNKAEYELSEAEIRGLTQF